MECPKGCGQMVIIAKKQISGMGTKPIEFKVRFQCSKCGVINDLTCEE